MAFVEIFATPGKIHVLTNLPFKYPGVVSSALTATLSFVSAATAAQELSPLKKVDAEAVPVADNSAIPIASSAT